MAAACSDTVTSKPSRAGCFFFQPWAAAVGGILGGIIYYPCSLFVLHVMKVDDPTDSFVIHGVRG